MRPADAQETQLLMKQALDQKDRPSALCLSRQKLPILKLTDEQKSNVHRGAYNLVDVSNPDLIIVATGSEVSLALDTLPLLSSLQLKIKIVSMPSWELFDEQEAYKDSVLNPECTKRVP